MGRGGRSQPPYQLHGQLPRPRVTATSSPLSERPELRNTAWAQPEYYRPRSPVRAFIPIVLYFTEKAVKILRKYAAAWCLSCEFMTSATRTPGSLSRQP